MDLQRDMIASFSVASNIKHGPTKGDATEINWVEWLNKYLPERYKAAKAFVVDVHGDISEQIDVVIFDRQYSPFILNHKGAFYVPAESVYGVVEVKQTLNKTFIEYAGNKAATVRRLHRTSAPIPFAAGIHPPKKPEYILAGLLCTRSSWNPPLGSGLAKTLKGLGNDQRVDIGCCIQSGAFNAQYKDNGLTLDKSNNHDALLFFFLKLLSRLQQLGTVPAIDIEKYLATLRRN